ncbi:MAG: hypothetical protein AAF799_35035 [Myxococcota bacterium]
MEYGIAKRGVVWGLGTLLVLAGCGTEDPDDGMSSAAGASGGDANDDADAPATGDEPGDGTGSPATTDAAETDANDDDPPGDETDGDDEGTDDGSTGEPGDDTGVSEEPGPDLREAGPFSVDVTTGNAPLSTGCSMNYDLYAPAGEADAPVVVLAHGFMGNRASMAGWADHWASWGLTVVAPDLCHATILDADHPQNGDDLRALVTELDLGGVIYAGYSAGGLAAVLAAAQDDQTVALLGLDMVDNSGQGAAAAANIDVPAFAIAGEPSSCNESSNGPPIFLSTPQGLALRITEADHCDFQSPADFLCGLTCSGTNNQFDDASIQAAVRGLSTAVVTWHSGVEPTGTQWWTPGAPYYEELFDLGIVQVP